MANETMGRTLEPTEAGLSNVFLMLVSLIGTVANILVLQAIFANRYLRTNTNYLFANLAAADFFVASLAIPLRLADDLHSTASRLVPCHVAVAFTILFDGVSRLNIVFISIDRFIAVKYPFWYDAQVSTKSVLFLTIGGWTFMGIFAVFPLAGFQFARVKLTTTVHGLCALNTALTKEYVLLFTVALCLVPLFLVIPLNCYLLRVSYHQISQIHKLQIGIEKSVTAMDNFSNCNSSSEMSRRLFALKQTKLARMVGLLVGLFAVLVAPITVIDLIEATSRIRVSFVAIKISVCLIYSSTVLNVFIYAGNNAEFRRAFRYLFQRCRTWDTSKLIVKR